MVDLKTTGCRGDFNPDNPSKGSSLQVFNGELFDKYPQTDAERQILDKHKLQLVLYSLALEAIESDKKEHERREILPPAILIGASGRCVELTQEEFETLKVELYSHLQWVATLCSEPRLVDEPKSCLEINGKVCVKCTAIDEIFGTE